MAADTPFVRRKIISVCSDWRKALVGISWVWTSIRIVSTRDTEVKFEKFLWNLTLQLERCGSLPINVYWRTCMDAAQTTQLFGLLAQKAPFSRWRTLELAAYDGSTLDNADVANMGDFQNLESFILCGSQVNCLLNLVNRSITSKLTNFDNRYLYMPLVQFRNEMDNLLKTITKFHLPYFSADADFELPANITELKLAAPLPLDLVERALMRSPRVMHLMFQIADSRKGWETIRRLFVEPPDWQRETVEATIVTTQMLNKIETTTATMPSKKTVMVGKSKWWRLCPRLRTVRVELKWNWTEAEGTVWTSFLQRILEERFGGTLQSATCAWNNGTELTAVVVSG
ncbi:hypothetical protein FRC20_003415 [Serendipita sp. 405]|nr:hypothetical protein FRC20_003415 [Serendipita sp. 405]